MKYKFDFPCSCERENWSFISRKGGRLRLFGKRVLRKIGGPKWGEVNLSWFTCMSENSSSKMKEDETSGRATIFEKNENA
jgi:hypothetical protein